MAAKEKKTIIGSKLGSVITLKGRIEKVVIEDTKKFHAIAAKFKLDVYESKAK